MPTPTLVPDDNARRVVPVAVKPARLVWPEPRKVPWTARVAPGEVVPTPVFPLVVFKYALPVTVSCVMVALPLKVARPATVKVPVAVTLATFVMSPDKSKLPCTARRADGLVVPMPTAPEARITNLMLLGVKIPPVVKVKPSLVLGFT